MLQENVELTHPALLLNFTASHSLLNIFESFFTPQLVTDLLEKRKQERPKLFSRKSGESTVQKLHVRVEHVFQYLACRSYIHGNRALSGLLQQDAMETAKGYLEEGLPNKLACYDYLQKAHAATYLHLNSDEEKAISKNFSAAIKSLGQAFAGDEKLFYFTGKHGWVQLVKNKPARLGIWHYQATTTLKNGLPFLFFTKAHAVDMNRKETIPTHVVVQEWLDTSLGLNPNSTLVMDSYYMAKEAQKAIQKSGRSVLAACQKKRFEGLHDLLSPKVTKAGTSAWAHNTKTGESAVLHWSTDTNIGLKLAYSTAHVLEKGRIPKGEVPIYDNYNSTFSQCDKFNKALSKRTWPFKSGGRGQAGLDGNAFNYFFSCALVNTYHAYLCLQDMDIASLSFEQAMEELAQAMAVKYVSHA